MKEKLLAYLKSYKPSEIIFLISFSILYFLTPSLKYLLSFVSITLSNHFNIVLIALYALFCLFILTISIKKRAFALRNSFCLSIVFYMIAIILSTFINQNGDTVLTPLLLTSMLLVIFQGIKLFTSTKRVLLSALIATLMFCMVFIIRYLPEIIQNKTINRLGEEFGDLNEVGMYFSIGIVLALAFISIYRDKKGILISAILFLLTLFCGICTGSKAFIFCSFTLIIAGIIMFFGKKGWYFSLITLFILVILTILILTLPIFSSVGSRFLQFVFSLFSGDSSLDASSSDRFKMVQDGLILFLRRPIFGFGNRGYYHFSSTGGGGWSHNNYTEVLVQYGLFGFVIFIYPFVASFYKLIKNKLVSKASKISLLFIIFFAVYFLSVSFDTLKIYSLAGAIFFAISLEIDVLEGGKYEKTNSTTYFEIRV